MSKKTKAESQETDQNADAFALPTVVDISTAVQLHEDLKTHVAALSGDLVIDAEQVDRFTTPAVQLIIATCETAKAADHGCTIHNPSEAVQQSFSELGLSDRLQAMTNT